MYNNNNFQKTTERSRDVPLVIYTVSISHYNLFWKIIIFSAPIGCGQYFTSAEGVIKGFNADGPDLTDYYLANLNYAICIRKGKNVCSVSNQNIKNII